MKLKLRLNWKKILLFLLLSAGLIYLTRSLLMSIGIMMLLFVIDALLANYEYRKNTDRLFAELKQRREAQAAGQQQDAGEVEKEPSADVDETTSTHK